MNLLATIGKINPSIQYADRPTVKVIIKKDHKLLILNKGLLPGGGVEPGESDQDAISRELQEELGVTVKDVQKIGTVVQYRDLIDKKYVINGYAAELDTTGGPTNPQDEGEAEFIVEWFTLDEALARTLISIEEMKLKPVNDAANQQSKLYNLMTAYAFLKTQA